MSYKTIRAAVLFLTVAAAPAAAVGPFPFAFEFSGTDFFLLVDSNNDGMPGPNDCRYRILLAGSNPFDFPNIRIEAVQGAPALNLCSGAYIGDLLLGSDSSSDYAEVDIDTTDMPPGVTSTPPNPLAGLRYYPPMEVELIDEFNGPPDGFPMSATEIVITGQGDELLFALRPCSAGGSALQIVSASGLSALVALEEYGPPGDPSHLKMSGLPFETTGGSLVMRDAYFPIENRALTGTVGDHEVLEIPIDGLAGCGRTSAPAAGQWMLGALFIALLAVGSAALGRWDSFYRGLPRP